MMQEQGCSGFVRHVMDVRFVFLAMARPLGHSPRIPTLASQKINKESWLKMFFIKCNYLEHHISDHPSSNKVPHPCSKSSCFHECLICDTHLGWNRIRCSHCCIQAKKGIVYEGEDKESNDAGKKHDHPWPLITFKHWQSEASSE